VRALETLAVRERRRRGWAAAARVCWAKAHQGEARGVGKEWAQP